MKHSIRVKITFLLIALIVFTIFLIWFINRTFLDDYYLRTKKDNLNEAYYKIQSIYNSNEGLLYLSDDNTEKMERLASNYDVNISVFMSYTNQLFSLIYPEPGNIGKRESSQKDLLLMEYLLPGSNSMIKYRKLIHDSEDYGIFTLYDSQLDAKYIDLFGYLGNGKTIIMRSNFESIEDSIVIANKFLAYIGLLSVLIGIAVMLIISKQFTKPILELSGIAKKMSELDFDVKYHVKSKDEIGELGHSINALSDKLETTISELKQANNELLTDIQKKTEIDEMRKEFLSNVSHELKTPLSLIQGYAEGLKENIHEDDEAGRDFYCEVIMDEADKMNKMVKKLLTLNELEFGNNQVNFERFDIVALISSVIETSEILFKQKGITVRFEKQEPIYVWADEFLVEQVVTNYISNAIHYVSDPNIIEIKLIHMENVIRIAVFNTGDNIPEEELDKIWVKFYKIDKARTREYGGNGIGLSIVKAIMNSLNKECGVINRQAGVEFWFELDTKI
ncbi:HAMP domain-containing protein [Mobilitalea sibirica]|uniref:histidine kinase n=1 Tax=Mobilitalea sibirica TaxID=1462919 RepID=A0A8J7H1K5_9FIRM|nr:HAMP domain-containing sensor histidine kinase [Mobilitalea sibirica]MBH1940292.1 HAMP domain-containing protein [Mobilitalea sibirica]